MSLHLSSLALSHFRSHRRAEIAVDARPVAIYGPNGAGKTNLIEALSLLHLLLGSTSFLCIAFAALLVRNASSEEEE